MIPHITSMWYHIVSMYVDHYVYVVSQSILRLRTQPTPLKNRRSVELHRTYSILYCKPLVFWQQITMNASIHQKRSEYTASNRAKRHPGTQPTRMSSSVIVESEKGIQYSKSVTPQLSRRPAWQPSRVSYFRKIRIQEKLKSCCVICSNRIWHQNVT